MWMAHIDGWDSVQVFSEDKEKAKRKALQIKKRRCKDDLEKWTWDNCDEFYGAWVVEVKEGLILYDNRDYTEI